MDIMEATPQTSNEESINQLQYNQSNFETIATDDFKDENVTTFNHSEDNFNISASSTEFNDELIIKENILDESVNNAPIEYPITTESMEVSECVPAEQSHSGYPDKISPEITLNSDNLEFTAIPLQENIEHAINPVKTDLNAASEETIALTGDNVNLLVSSETVENILNTGDSVENAKVEIIEESLEKIIEKSESMISKSNEHKKDEGQPLFIGEVDESVSLPPAEPLIAEHEEIAQPNADVQTNVEEDVTQDSIEEHNIQENIVEENADPIILSDSIEENEIETTHAEIIAEGETHIQYTVLPPGENSVYQEDGTLVVEYPLNNITELNENVTQNSDNFVEDPPEKTEMTLNTEIKAVKPQPKPKGRKSAGQIPLHILGHNIDKPVQDVLNGKPILKPRLGVKIPYRNLASQIVSTTELRQQIVERARQKQESQNQVSHSSIFAKKLTHRLAQSLSGKGKIVTLQKDSNNEKKPSLLDNVNVPKIEETSDDSNLGEPTSNSVISNPIEIVETDQGDNIEYIQTLQESINRGSRISKSALEESDSAKSSDKLDSQNSSSNIESNSDLIAILEGDGDEVSSVITLSKPLENKSFDNNSSDIKEIEKEISLTEQKTMPAPQVKGKKFFKSRESRFSDMKEKVHNAKDNLSSNHGSKDSELKNAKVIGSVLTSGEIKIHSNSKLQDAKISAGPKNLPKSADEKKNIEKNLSEQKEKKLTEAVIDVEPRLKPAMALKTYTRKRKSNEVSTPEPTKKQIIETPPSQSDSKIDIVSSVPPNAYVTKSSRVIKKKVIWDPDEAMPSVRNQSKILSKIESTTKGTSSPKTGVTIKASTSKSTSEKKAVQDKLMETPKSAKPIEKKTIKVIAEEKEKMSASPDKQLMKKPDKTEVPKKIKSPTVVKNVVVLKSLTVVKGQSEPTEEDVKYQQGKSPKKSSKRLSEIDRLLMDEGAVNMLYDINNSEDQKRRASSRTAVASNDKAQLQKELMDRTQEIKNELTQGTSSETMPKILRKKEGTPTAKKDTSGPQVVRKMSKDSSKSSIHSPPPSPAAFTLAEASRIIRRHSSSSFSSNDELVQESLAELEEKQQEKEKQLKKKLAPAEPSSSNTLPETTSPEKQMKERPVKKRLTSALENSQCKKVKKDDVVEEEECQQQKPVEIAMKCEPGIVTGELKTDPNRTFTLIKMNKHYMINLTYSGGENYLTVQLLKDLTFTLKELVRNKNCNVVSIHSQGPAFCLGLDYKGLIESDVDLRKKRAKELSTCVREFLKCLLHFPKVLVAGIRGDCVGFGVTMLPLFDMIVASDSASFCSPYAKLGCAPEAGFLLSIPFQSNTGLAAELLYTCQRMNADEAQRRGLVTKLFWPEKFDTEFRALLMHISNLSRAGLMRIKKELRVLHTQSTETAINSSCRMLIKCWCSEECQKSFSNYNALTFDIDQ